MVDDDEEGGEGEFSYYQPCHLPCDNPGDQLVCIGVIKVSDQGGPTQTREPSGPESHLPHAGSLGQDSSSCDTDLEE